MKVQTVYNEYKSCGMQDSELPSAIKMRFFANKNILRTALVEGLQEQEKIASAVIYNEQIIQKLLDKPGFEIYKPFFDNIKRFDTESEIKREIEFLNTALTVLNNLLEIKSDEKKMFMKDVHKFVDMLKVITDSAPENPDVSSV